ncbi:S1 family peptidase [Ramlibacter humi]|uniref:Serine protease n=1 Tax=Ramlibacter humi TaxID=2530451 RepID=A0A4Z0C8B7_9BURK|nr:serine protease [Ramlibacter humi]TFZ07926.1 serine protease [Ramlibacter humi]
MTAGIAPLLLSVVRVLTFDGMRPLTAGSGFFFQREGRLFLVTSRHVFHDAPAGHFPDRIEMVLHASRTDLTDTRLLRLPLYEQGTARWHQAVDGGGEVDVAVLGVDRAQVPEATAACHFAPDHLPGEAAAVDVGAPLVLVGFPLGFYDTVHHLPVARQAIVASAYGVRFQGLGYFLTDARMHRGTSGAPVVMRRADDDGPLPWTLLGVHSARLDMGTRDTLQDDRLGLNCAWYADILLALTRPELSRPSADGRPADGAASAPPA